MLSGQVLGGTRAAGSAAGGENRRAVGPRQRVSQLSCLGSIAGSGAGADAVRGSGENDGQNHPDYGRGRHAPASDALAGAGERCGLARGARASGRRLLRDGGCAHARLAVDGDRVARAFGSAGGAGAPQGQDARFSRYAVDWKGVLWHLGGR